MKSQLALAKRLDVVELHPQAAERYAAKVADIRAALTGGDTAGLEAIARDPETEGRAARPRDCGGPRGATGRTPVVFWI